LDIIKIKRTDFLNDEKVNNDVETYVNDFVSYLKTIANFDDEKLNDLILSYKVNLYNEIVKTLSKISDLYLNNFVSEVSSALNSVLDINDLGDDKYARSDTLNSFVPEMEIPIVPNIPEIPEVPDAPDALQNDVETLDGYKENEEIKDDEVSIVTPEAIIPDVPDVPNVPDVALDTEEVKPMDVPNVVPIEMESDRKSADVKKTYDVEEILKIAKSPVVTMPVNEPQVKEGYLSVSPIESSQEAETLDPEFDESEIVEEMIRRLTKRLDVIKERQEKYDAEEQKLKDDEAFVNDLIQSSNAKREELDKFEEELDAKEKEIDEKQRELEKKINDVLPFADAVMKTSEEEA
jgi:hypothetical protein